MKDLHSYEVTFFFTFRREPYRHIWKIIKRIISHSSALFGYLWCARMRMSVNTQIRRLVEGFIFNFDGRVDLFNDS